MPQTLKKELLKTHSRLVFLDEVPEFAAKLAKSLKPGDRVSLTGEIGAGKTTFVFFLLQALGREDGASFSSPTFTVLNQYNSPQFMINHIDLYRLNSFAEFENLDFTAQIETPGALTFIEWGDKFPQMTALFNKKIHFEYVGSRNLERLVQFEGF